MSGGVPLSGGTACVTRGDNLRYAIAFALRRSRKTVRGLKQELTEEGALRRG